MIGNRMKLDQPTTLEAIANYLNMPYKGESHQQIAGLNEIHKVEQGDLTFVDHPRYYEKVLDSAATTIIINKDIDPPAGKGLIISEDPFTAYNTLVDCYQNHRDTAEKPDYYQGHNVDIGKNSVIFPGVYLGNDVSIGDRCVIYPNAVIGAGSKIGHHVTIHGNVTIGGDAFYYKDRGTYHDKLHSGGRVVIEDHVEIGAACTIDRGVSGLTLIEEGTKLDAQVHVGHGVEIGKNCIIAAQVGIGGKTILEDRVKLWGQVGINKGLRIREGTEVLALSGISKSTEPDTVYFGAPAVPKGQAYKETASMRKLPEWMKSIEEKLDSLLKKQ